VSLKFNILAAPSFRFWSGIDSMDAVDAMDTGHDYRVTGRRVTELRAAEAIFSPLG
jgi:hypothetical protein